MPSPAILIARSIRHLTATVLGLGVFVLHPAIVLAHPGHGDEFHGEPTPSIGELQVDTETAQRLQIKVEPVTRQRLAFGIKTTGQIEPLPNQQVEVMTPVGGTVLRLFVKPGDRVTAGQAVAIMTSPELAELRTTALDRQTEATGAVQQAQADLQLAQRHYVQQQKIADRELQQAQTAFNVAQERYNKDQEIVAQGALPRRQMLESQAQLAETRAALAKAQSRLSVSEAEAQVQRVRSALEVAQSRVQLSSKPYETRLRQLGASANTDGTLTITAPISGTIVDREATPGESGQDAGKKILTIVNDGKVQVSGNVYEKDIDQVRVGQAVRVKVNGLPDRTFSGRIRVVNATVEGQTRAVPVKAEIDNSDGALKPGMFAELEVLTDRTPVSGLVVPKSAIVDTHDNKKLVFVQNGKAFAPTEVTLGREAGEWVEVTNGLFDGDKVVTQRAPQLYAQSLRRGKTTDDDTHAQTATTPSSGSNASLPWWIMLPVGGAIAAGTFWAGNVWASRRYRQGQRIEDGASVSPNNSGNYFHPKDSTADGVHSSIEVVKESGHPHQN